MSSAIPSKPEASPFQSASSSSRPPVSAVVSSIALVTLQTSFAASVGSGTSGTDIMNLRIATGFGAGAGIQVGSLPFPSRSYAETAADDRSKRASTQSDEAVRTNARADVGKGARSGTESVSDTHPFISWGPPPVSPLAAHPADLREGASVGGASSPSEIDRLSESLDATFKRGIKPRSRSRSPEKKSRPNESGKRRSRSRSPRSLDGLLSDGSISKNPIRKSTNRPPSP